MSQESFPIGVFDSGLGGLSVLRALRLLLPAESFIYVGDSAYAPYGDKSLDVITERARQITQFLVDHPVKAVVVACNTATAVAVEGLRSEFDLPIIAMEPAIKPAAALTKSDVVAVLATAGTFNSNRYANLRDLHGKKIQVMERVCHHWVQRVEAGDLHSDATRAQVAEDIQPALDQNADVMVLGCTHFPFLGHLVQDIVGNDVAVVDPAPAVARQLRNRLADINACSPTATSSSLVRYYTSGDTATFAQRIALLLQQPEPEVTQFPL